MNKEKILKKSDDFTKIINQNQKVKSKYFSVYYQPSNQVHYGITVPKKIGHAVTRNKLKRQIKNIIYNNEKDIQQGFNYVISHSNIRLCWLRKRIIIYNKESEITKNNEEKTINITYFLCLPFNRLYQNIER